jgi:hypothetical protein
MKPAPPVTKYNDIDDDYPNGEMSVAFRHFGHL